jgi:hypothetical protein
MAKRMTIATLMDKDANSVARRLCGVSFQILPLGWPCGSAVMAKRMTIATVMGKHANSAARGQCGVSFQILPLDGRAWIFIDLNYQSRQNRKYCRNKMS